MLVRSLRECLPEPLLNERASLRRLELAPAVCSPDRGWHPACAWLFPQWELRNLRPRARHSAMLAGSSQEVLATVRPLASFGKTIPTPETIRSSLVSAESVALHHWAAGLKTGRCRSKDFTLVIDHPRKAQPECRALSRLARKVDCTIVQLDHSECCRQTDPAACLFGGEVKLKHPGRDLARNARPRVADCELALAALARRSDGQCSPLRHGFHPIVNHVQNGLHQQIGIAVDP